MRFRIMKLRRRIINETKGDPRKQKAVALAICIKRSCGRNSTVKDYNPNKIQKLTGISPNTFTKYLPTMVEMGLVRFDGKNGEHLVVRCLHSSKDDRNVDIHRFCFNSFTEVYRSLRAFLVVLVQVRKDYVSRILQIATDPKKGQNCSAAKKKVRNLVRRGILRTVNEKVKELGISYKRFAKETGNCERTCERIVQYAIKRRWWKKHTHYEWTYMPGVNSMPVEGYLFTTRDYGFNVGANTYTLSNRIRRCCGMVINRW